MLAALQAGSREVRRVVLGTDLPHADRRDIEQAAQDASVPIQRLTRAQIDALAQGKTHGGVVAEAGERTFLSMEALLSLIHI